MRDSWKLNGYCPECRKWRKILGAKKVQEIMSTKFYYEKMAKDKRHVAKCVECGAYMEEFNITLSKEERKKSHEMSGMRQ